MSGMSRHLFYQMARRLKFDNGCEGEGRYDNVSKYVILGRHENTT